MLCSKCRTFFTGLACPGCLEEKSFHSYLEFQRMHLPRVLHDGLKIRVVRKRKSEPFCMVLFGDPSHTYCARLIEPPVYREQVVWPTYSRELYCPSCLQVFDTLTHGLQTHAPEAATA